MATVEFDMSEFRAFFNQVERAAKGGFRRELELFLESWGTEFLKMVQDEIETRKVMSSRLLLHSFNRGDEGNVWRLEEGGLVLEVGTNLDYASYTNDGHWTNTKGVERRWVPGYWRGDQFIYDPKAKTGMLLKQHWVEGAHYFDAAFRALEDIFPGAAEKRLQEWLDKYFGG